MEQALIKLGLSAKEAKVYLAALELGEDTVQNIAKKSRVNRATTYVILEKLRGLGLVSSVEQDKKTKFIAENPQELENIIEQEKRLVDARRHYLDEAMSQLMALHNSKKGKPVVRYFEGADGLETLDKLGIDALKKGEEQLSIMPVDLIERLFASRRQSGVKYRVKLGIKSKTIYTRASSFNQEEDKAQLREGIFLPRDLLPINASIQIYPNWGVKFYTFDENHYLGVLIQSPVLANNFKVIFDLAWRGALTFKT